MPDKWKIRGSAFMDALTAAGVGTIDELAKRVGIARGTAARVMRGEVVQRATVIAVCNKLRDGEAYRASELFEAAE